jgi:amino-acid N-acetyltransferase
MPQAPINLADLRGILQYVPRFRDRIFVIAIDGQIAASDNLSNILTDIAVLRSLNIRIILVHGVGFQLRKTAAEKGLALSNSDGTGITDIPTLDIAVDTATRLTHEIMEGLTTVDLRAAYTNCLIAHPAGILSGVDQLYTGKIEKVDIRCLEVLLEEGIIPVIPPIGFDGEGRTYRVNSDAIAVEVGEAMRAAKIIFMFAQDGLSLNGQMIRQIPAAEAEDIVKKRRLADNPEMHSKLEHAARASRQGVPRVHLVNGTVNEALLTEIFSNEGIGTMVYSNEYQQIRRLFKKDVRSVMTLIRQSVDSDELMRRTRQEILQQIEDYWVLEIDRNLVGCVALHNYPEAQAGELGCLYVSRRHENQGYGVKLMAFVEEVARSKGYKRLIALSTQAFAYLEQKGGFKEVSPEELPAPRREKYAISGRHSRVLVKDLS